MKSIVNYKESLLNWFNELRLSVRLEPVPETATSLENGERDETFDVLKGLAILLVIIGHCEIGALHSFIYSFHVPLFFFVSGYFLKQRPVRDEVRLNFKRLIIPYAFTAICICIVAVCKDLSNYTYADGSFSQGMIITSLIGFMGQISPPPTYRPYWYTLVFSSLILGKNFGCTRYK